MASRKLRYGLMPNFYAGYQIHFRLFDTRVHIRDLTAIPFARELLRDLNELSTSIPHDKVLFTRSQGFQRLIAA